VVAVLAKTATPLATQFKIVSTAATHKRSQQRLINGRRDAPTATVGLRSAAERSTFADRIDGLPSDIFRGKEAAATPASGHERA